MKKYRFTDHCTHQTRVCKLYIHSILFALRARKIFIHCIRVENHPIDNTYVNCRQSKWHQKWEWMSYCQLQKNTRTYAQVLCETLEHDVNVLYSIHKWQRTNRSLFFQTEIIVVYLEVPSWNNSQIALAFDSWCDFALSFSLSQQI